MTTSVAISLFCQCMMLGSADSGDLSAYFFLFISSHMTFYLA